MPPGAGLQPDEGCGMSQGLEASGSLAQGTKKESARAEDAGKESGGQVQKEGKGLRGRGAHQHLSGDVGVPLVRAGFLSPGP